MVSMHLFRNVCICVFVCVQVAKGDEKRGGQPGIIALGRFVASKSDGIPTGVTESQQLAIRAVIDKMLTDSFVRTSNNIGNKKSTLGLEQKEQKEQKEQTEQTELALLTILPADKWESIRREMITYETRRMGIATAISKGTLGVALGEFDDKMVFVQAAKNRQEKAYLEIEKILRRLENETLLDLPSEQQVKAKQILKEEMPFGEVVIKVPANE